MTRILANYIITPDGTILQSYHRHDYKTYIDKNGEEYMVDGGCDYLRTNINYEPPEFVRITTDDPHETQRKWFHWGTYGKDGDQPLTYKPLKDLTTEHIEAILKTQVHLHSDLINVFKNELTYRKEHDNQTVRDPS